MGRLCWVSDIHLNFLDEENRQRFYDQLAAHKPDALVVSGDIGTAPTVVPFLDEMHRALPCRILFVLGNHDFYHGSISGVRDEVARASRDNPTLVYLSCAEAVELSPDACVVGHDGWCDARHGNYRRSTVVLNDFWAIRELMPLDKECRRLKLQDLADEGAAHLRVALSAACPGHRRVYVVTHVPPFPEACLYRGKPSDEAWLPFFCSKATGDVLRSCSEAWPDVQFHVLCGHTHDPAEIRIAHNLNVCVAGAAYHTPSIAAMIDVP